MHISAAATNASGLFRSSREPHLTIQSADQCVGLVELLSQLRKLRCHLSLESCDSLLESVESGSYLTSSLQVGSHSWQLVGNSLETSGQGGVVRLSHMGRTHDLMKPATEHISRPDSNSRAKDILTNVRGD